MAKCTITFEDTEDGGTAVNVAFDPPINNPMHEHTPTQAQEMGWVFAELLMQAQESASVEGDEE